MLKQFYYFAGNLTYVDFLAYETFDWLRLFSPGTLEKFDNLANYQKRFESLPAIQAYMKSSEFIKWPLFVPVAKFGYFKEK